MRRKRLVTARRFITLLGIALVGILALGLYVPGLRWRLELVALKAAGEIPDLAWNEVWPILAPDSGAWPVSIASTRNPYTAISAPPATAADVSGGGETFRTSCASCHDAASAGAEHVDLTSGHFQHGASDWALFQTIRRGVPGTAMPPSSLDAASIWQLVAYLKHTVLEANPYRSPTTDTGHESVATLADVSTDALAHAGESTDWLTYGGAYDGQRHSPLTAINRDNAGRLALDWIFQLPADDDPVATTPLVVGDVMFINRPRGDVWALDAPTGEVLWHYTRGGYEPTTVRSSDGLATRGMAILDHTLFVTTIDARLLALDARTGRLLWNVQVADHASGAGYAIVGAPLAVGSRVIVGVAGSDRGLRGFLDAYSAEDGSRLWRFDTVPGPAEPGHDTWGDSDAWRRGGGLTSMTGTYDPNLNLIYWGTGNPTPAFLGDIRPGDNLYTSSILAIDASTGQLRWHFQISPHDERDWGATHVPVLVDRASDAGGQVLHVASRNGFFYTLDRITGRFLRATPFVRQTWNDGFDASGRPIEKPNSRPTPQGTFAYPGHAGATNWAPPSYDPATQLFFVVARDGYASVFYKSQRLSWPDGAYWGGRAGAVTGTSIASEIRAIDAPTGEIRWSYRFPGSVAYVAGGVLSTAGGLVFAGEKQRFVALDSATGQELWHFNAGGAIEAAPMSYEGDQRQHVTVAAGTAILTFSVTAP